MAQKSIIMEDLKKLDLNDIIKKYNTGEDICKIFYFLIEERKFDYLGNFIMILPRLEKYDVIKSVVLRDCNHLLPPFLIFLIIESVFDEKRKVELLEKYYKKLNGFEIVGIINSFNDDNIKKELFRLYHKRFNSDDFTDYLVNIKDDDTRTSEFVSFKDEFPNYRLDLIAFSYSDDEMKSQRNQNNNEELNIKK